MGVGGAAREGAEGMRDGMKFLHIGKKEPDSGTRIRNKEFKHLCYLALGNMIQDDYSGFRIQGLKKVSDPISGFATLF
jgi:hypothetical protein